jgi:hypothetical protein
LFLKEAADVLAVDPEADHAARAVDLLNRVRRNEAAAPREKPGLDGKRVRNVGSGAVHRALDLADEAPLPIGDDVAGSPAEIDGERAHVLKLRPPCKGFTGHGVKGLLTQAILLPTMSG